MITARATALPQVAVHYFVEQGAQGDLRSGRLSAEVALPLIRAPFETDYYLSGPPTMLQTLRQQLQGQGVAAETIFVDAWG